MDIDDIKKEVKSLWQQHATGTLNSAIRIEVDSVLEEAEKEEL
jgi:hypothetical protein